MDVDPETVDFSIERPSPSIEPSDYQVSRQFTYLVRNVKNVRNMSDLVTRIRKQKDWASDPTFINLNPTVKKWLDDLPSDLRVTFPEGDAPPWLPNHFVGNMHAYYHLNIIMLHRPQLMAANFSAGGTWKQHMTLCYNSAKAMCRLQAAVLQSFGLSGLLCMQRGINFVIYSVLTCTMIHLVGPRLLIASRSELIKLRLQSPRQIQTLIAMRGNTSHATCESSRNALLRGPCPRCKHRLMPCEKLFPLIQQRHSNSEQISHTAALVQP